VSSIEEVLAVATISVVLLAMFTALVAGPLVLFAVVVYAGARHGVRATVLAMVLGVVLLYAYTLTPLPRMGIGALYFAVPPLQMPLVKLDFALSRAAREEVIRWVDSGSLPESERHGGYELPDGSKGLSVYGIVDVIDDDCGRRVFFMTVTGFSPDPYGGFEFVPASCQPAPDPLGSGAGVAHPLGGGWFWINAS
jgi:hypothetical protein